MLIISAKCIDALYKGRKRLVCLDVQTFMDSDHDCFNFCLCQSAQYLFGCCDSTQLQLKLTKLIRVCFSINTGSRCSITSAQKRELSYHISPIYPSRSCVILLYVFPALFLLSLPLRRVGTFGTQLMFQFYTPNEPFCHECAAFLSLARVGRHRGCLVATGGVRLAAFDASGGGGCRGGGGVPAAQCDAGVAQPAAHC